MLLGKLKCVWALHINYLAVLKVTTVTFSQGGHSSDLIKAYELQNIIEPLQWTAETKPARFILCLTNPKKIIKGCEKRTRSVLKKIVPAFMD